MSPAGDLSSNTSHVMSHTAHFFSPSATDAHKNTFASFVSDQDNGRMVKFSLLLPAPRQSIQQIHNNRSEGVGKNEGRPGSKRGKALLAIQNLHRPFFIFFFIFFMGGQCWWLIYHLYLEFNPNSCRFGILIQNKNRTKTFHPPPETCNSILIHHTHYNKSSIFQWKMEKGKLDSIYLLTTDSCYSF